MQAAMPLTESLLDRAETLLQQAGNDFEDESKMLRWRSSQDVTALLKVAVGCPEATDAELLGMLGARVNKMRQALGCGGCNGEHCKGKQHPQPHPHIDGPSASR